MQKNNDDEILSFSANPPPEQPVKRVKAAPQSKEPVAAKAAQPEKAGEKPEAPQTPPDAGVKTESVSATGDNAVAQSNQTSDIADASEPLVLPPAVQTSLKKIFLRIKESAPVQFIADLSLKAKLLLSLIFLPALCVFLYYGLIASPMYITETRFAVRGPDSGGLAVTAYLRGD